MIFIRFLFFYLQIQVLYLSLHSFFMGGLNLKEVKSVFMEKHRNLFPVGGVTLKLPVKCIK